MIIPINWLNYYVAIYQYMKMTYHNHDMGDYIDYHDIRYILHITTYVPQHYVGMDQNLCDSYVIMYVITLCKLIL